MVWMALAGCWRRRDCPGLSPTVCWWGSGRSCLLILGVLTRPAALVLAFTMVVAWLMVGLDKTFALDTVGAWAIENLVYFFVGALAIALLGAGRYSLAGQSAWR